jgi:hypothetical protein
MSPLAETALMLAVVVAVVAALWWLARDHMEPETEAEEDLRRELQWAVDSLDEESLRRPEEQEWRERAQAALDRWEGKRP